MDSTFWEAVILAALFVFFLWGSLILFWAIGA